MCLHRLQNCVAHRHRGCLLAASGAALPAGCWRSPCRASSPPLLGRLRFSTESRQNAFGDFQLIELVAQLCPFAIEPREPLGNPLLLLPNLVQCRHLLFPFSWPQYRHDTLRRYSPTNRGLTHDAAKKTLKQSGPQRSSRQARLPYIRPPLGDGPEPARLRDLSKRPRSPRCELPAPRLAATTDPRRRMS